MLSGCFMFHRSTVVLFLLLLVCAVSVWRHPTPREVSAVYFHDADRVQFDDVRAVVVREPDVSEHDQRITIAVDGLGAQEEYYVRITTDVYPFVRIGDVFELSCVFKRPEPFDGFAYDAYLLRYRIIAECRQPQIRIIGREETILTHIIDQKLWLIERLQRDLPLPEAGLLLGIVFGEMRALPDEILQAFQVTGTSHLLVISGSNIVLITGWIQAFLRCCTAERGRILIILVALTGYTVMTGVQPSATRAAIFGGIILCSNAFGRPNQALRGLVYTGIVMVILNPLILLYDAGFQLSWLASCGMIVWSDRLTKALSFVPERFELRAAASATLSATLITTPLLVAQFQVFSVIGFIANLFLVPLLSSFLLLGILYTACAVVLPWLAALVSVPFLVVLRYSVTFVLFFSHVPYAQVPTTVPVSSMVMCYAVLGIYILYVMLKKPQYHFYE